ncbi:hypothetical protein PJO47_29520, partial [Mycobacterium kansasii]
GPLFEINPNYWKMDLNVNSNGWPGSFVPTYIYNVAYLGQDHLSMVLITLTNGPLGGQRIQFSIGPL